MREVAPLAERNSIVQGIAKGKTYAADIWSGEKSFSDVLSDGAEMVDKSVIQPISKASELEVFKLDLLTTSYEQNVEAGRVAGEGALVLVDTVGTVATVGEYAAARGTMKVTKELADVAVDAAASSRKLPDGGASGKIPLHPSISHHPKKKGPPKDGKFKTHAKSLAERFEELEAAIGKLLGKMPKDMAERMPFKVAYKQMAGTNQRVPTIIKNSDHPMYSKMDGENGGGSGRRAEGTGNGVPKHNYSASSKNHLIKPEGVNKTGVSGGHNAKEFFDYLDANGIPYKVENKVPHPSVPGVYDVYYKIAKQERGVYTSEFKASTHKKTVYDETVFTDEQMYKYCQEAMDNGTEYLTRGGQQVIQGTASNGLKFEGWKNPTTGEIESVYPVLEWKNYGN